jgi:hypothetical protein
MLWFFHAGDAKYDPIYGVFRRDSLVRTRFPYPSERTDWLVCAELALLGPIVHVDDLLSNRTRDYTRINQAAFRRRLDPALAEQLKTSPLRLYGELNELVVSTDLSEAQLRRCKSALRRFWAKDEIREARSRVADARHRMFGR